MSTDLLQHAAEAEAEAKAKTAAKAKAEAEAEAKTQRRDQQEVKRGNRNGKSVRSLILRTKT